MTTAAPSGLFSGIHATASAQGGDFRPKGPPPGGICPGIRDHHSSAWTFHTECPEKQGLVGTWGFPEIPALQFLRDQPLAQRSCLTGAPDSVSYLRLSNKKITLVADERLIQSHRYW